MSRHLAFVHTSPVHVDTFEHLAKGLDPTLRVSHVVAEDLLADAQRLGTGDAGLVARVHGAMAGAAAKGATVVVCTCSTIGGAAERAPGPFIAHRIDRAMADEAVRVGPRILVVAALESTLSPTQALIGESARAAGAEVSLQPLLVRQAWPFFQAGDTAAYLRTVADAVRAAAGHADVVVLAQASMAPAAQLLTDLPVPVLASPALGVQRALARL